MACDINSVNTESKKEVTTIAKSVKGVTVPNEGSFVIKWGATDPDFKSYEDAFDISNKFEREVQQWATDKFGQNYSVGFLKKEDVDGGIRYTYSMPTKLIHALRKNEVIVEGRQTISQELDDLIEAQNNDITDELADAILNYDTDFDSTINEESEPKPEVELTEQDQLTAGQYIVYKQKLLSNLQEKLDNYKRLNRAVKNTEDYQNTVNRFQSLIDSLESEISDIDIKDANTVFSDVLNQIEELSGIIDSADYKAIAYEEVMGRIQQLYEMIKGVDMTDPTKVVDSPSFNRDTVENYDDTMVRAIDELVAKVGDKQQAVIRDILDQDIIFQANKTVIPKEEIDKLFEDMPDINILQQMFLGINSNDDSIITTLLSTTLQTNYQKTAEAARPDYNNIKDKDVRLKAKGFDESNFYEKDEDGIDTGNITHMFSKKFHKVTNQYYKALNNFYKAPFKEKAKAFEKALSILNNNTDIIDFRKLRYFKGLYGDAYSDHFTATDAEMDAYEDQLREQLGVLYDDHIAMVEDKLAEYESYRLSQEVSNDKYSDKNIQLNSPWVFMNNYTSNNTSTEYIIEGETRTGYNMSNRIVFIPKKQLTDQQGQTTDSGFYNSQFENIANDEDALSYWRSLRDLYVNHINPTYATQGQHVASMSWAKVEKDIYDAMQSSQKYDGILKDVMKTGMNSFKEMWYDKSFDKDKSGVVTNYSDTSRRKIASIRKLLMAKNVNEVVAEASNLGISTKDVEKFELADKIARKRVLQNYSRDLTKTTLYLSDMATAHRARQETALVSEMMFNFHKSLKDPKTGEERRASNSKVRSWINANVYNYREATRENMAEKALSAKTEHEFFRYLTEQEKELKKIIDGVRKKSASEFEEYKFSIKNENDVAVTYEKDSEGKYTATIEGRVVDISESNFEKALEKHFDEEVNKLGIPLTVGGVIKGIMKVIIAKALALNPISGIFNRAEGMFSNMIMDSSGMLWKSGNLKHSKRFLAGANMLRISNNKLPLASLHKKQQLKTFQALLDELSLYQDRKNELDRKDSASRFEQIRQKVNLFQFAVDNPEFKNQGEIILSMLMDVRIKDKNGVEHPFFDGTQFTAYKPGTLELKDEFNTDENSSWESFIVDNDNPENSAFFVHKVRIEDGIKKTQGNYADLDSIQVMDTTWGKAMMMFMRWAPEHANQRFGIRRNDIVQGRQKVIGRYRGLLKSPASLGVYGTLVGGMAFGPFGFALGASATFLPFAIRMLTGKYMYGKDVVPDMLTELSTMAGYLSEILVGGLDNVSHLSYTGKSFGNVVPQKWRKLDQSEHLSEEEVQALKASAKELATMLMLFGMLMVAKGLLYDEEDEKDDTRRLLHNFMDNQLNRSIDSLMSWANPMAMINENSKIALLRYTMDVQKLVQVMWNYYLKDQGTANDIMHQVNKVQPFIPLPNSLNDAMFKTKIPGFDDKEYNNNQWFDAYFKGQEWLDKQRYTNKRKKLKEWYKRELIQGLEAKGYDKDDYSDALKSQLDTFMKSYAAKKQTGEGYSEALSRMEDMLPEVINRVEGGNVYAYPGKPKTKPKTKEQKRKDKELRDKAKREIERDKTKLWGRPPSKSD